MPYCTHENRIDGVVITFTDVSVAKNLEAALRKAQSDLEKRFSNQTAELGQARKNLQTKIRQQSKSKSDGGRAPGTGHNSKRPR
jgi:two-component system CheB/CheR fusion protein